jgi:ketosteroid isomerase-like protein
MDPSLPEGAPSSGPVADVLVANQAFYDAHEAADIEAMATVWEHSDRVVCVHPGWPILRTWPEVRTSWERIFAGPARNQFILTNVAVSIDGDLAFVTLEENLIASSGGTTGTGVVAATNILARIPTPDGPRWRLVAHHGSPVITG